MRSLKPKVQGLELEYTLLEHYHLTPNVFEKFVEHVRWQMQVKVEAMQVDPLLKKTERKRKREKNFKKKEGFREAWRPSNSNERAGIFSQIVKIVPVIVIMRRITTKKCLPFADITEERTHESSPCLMR
ncbi:uncharacterized protein LOC112875449 [Panicum hallii]|uniref:uncharacterized protein LOC112875449 n=1 Tax=Panicum hallii TaxID=206008 RepID=UPI000DF4DE13|nr:uncharacterized protein LOC112875449 [Panicum hallii]